MRTQVAKWGNSLAVRLPRQVAEQAGLSDGSAVDVAVVDGEVRIISKRPSYSLDQLLADITPDNIPDEIFDDGPVGRELL